MSQIKSLQKIFFPVRKVAATDLYKSDMDFNSWLSHRIVVDLPSGPREISVCGKDYSLVTNRELFTQILKEVEKEYDGVEVKVRMRDWARFYVDFVIKDLKLKGDGKKDILFPRMRINNSYDGSVKYSWLFGYYRLVCSNGAMAPVKGSERGEKLMHTPQVLDDQAIKQTLKALGKFMESAKNISEGFKPLIEHKLSMNDAIERITEIKKEVDYPTKLVEVAVGRLNHEANELKLPINDYLVYNAMNYALYQNTTSEQAEHKRDKTDMKVLDYLISENS